MFSEMRIRGVGVIHDAVLDLSPGLNVLTGETGAGKTMVVSGLGLLLGERADSSLVRSGADQAFVEGVVQLPPGHPALDRAAEAGAEHDDGELVIARTLSASGRSRAHVGGRTAPVGVLAELGRHLVAVHGQADQWRLKQGDAHREVLDGFGGPALGALRDRVGRLHDEWRGAHAEHDRLVAESRERAREIDSLTAALEEIEAVDPQPGEDLSLRAEDERLAHDDSLRLAAARALADLSGEEYAAEPAPSVRDLVGSARSALGHGAVHDSRLGDLDARLDEVAALVGDVAADLTAYLEDVDLDPQRLEFVQERRAALAGLTRKYGETVDEVLDWSQQAAARLDALVSADDRVESLRSQLDELTAELAAAASDLSAARAAAGADFAARVSGELAHLSMGKAVIEVRVEQRPAGDGILMASGERVRISRLGADDVEILLSANPGATPRSVAKAASGGELSRVMLALEVVGASPLAQGRPGSQPQPRAGTPPTFVFDEVDAGVGGRAALDVGARLAALAQQAQVIVVTHLAQVAAFADRHLVVHKSDDGAITSSSITVVDGEERLRELSRMMGGDPDSEAGLAHARDLLEQTAAARVSRVGAA
ncbi:DNA repair protein RecN [Intrasporangium calvum]|uniref:DNA repair protein RecN n=1 Tax=Intrasporangium calvum (strain ATCC 23552 / DSM 43043 / JCM 3097 / NBRC 12989 / NCIMB 10167 / NRRL B-3866 / 7 KIP) TaxID=710696 RepID=E6S8U4_INTC7|nr:DNA repair protein RecN [Intrasporangium calvum]ADU48081.1 DNA replication and repair protein RecN [Intrasporangium calvum DSM 43043]